MKNVVYDIAFKLPICCLITHDINNPMSINNIQLYLNNFHVHIC